MIELIPFFIPLVREKESVILIRDLKGIVFEIN